MCGKKNWTESAKTSTFLLLCGPEKERRNLANDGEIKKEEKQKNPSSHFSEKKYIA